MYAQESTGMLMLKHVKEKGSMGRDRVTCCVVQAGLKSERAADKRKWSLAGMPLRHVGLETDELEVMGPRTF